MRADPDTSLTAHWPATGTVSGVLVSVADDHVESLVAHLVGEGFPAVRAGEGLIDVLFPGSPILFPRAVELDDWLAQIDGPAPVCVTQVPGSLAGEPGTRVSPRLRHPAAA